MTVIPVLERVAPLAQSADVWFLDIWGVLHNGVKPFPGCVDACQMFRQGGGKVILVSNSPRPRDGVVRQLQQIGVPDTVYDEAVTSGDVSRTLIRAYSGKPVWHLGPERDRAIFTGLDVALAGPEEAVAIACTGLFDDEHDTPADYDEVLRKGIARQLPMICANPDLKVERGNRIIYCAGALAAVYEDLGGEVAYAGKPYPPIYEAAFAIAARLLGHNVPRDRVLAVGDGVGTDIAGAGQAGVRSIYVASPLFAARGASLSAVGDTLFADALHKPIAVMPALAW